MSYLDAKKVVYLQSIYKELEALVKEIGTVEEGETTPVTWSSITGDQSSVDLSGFTNDAGFITDTSNFVTLDTSQVLRGQKTFADGANIRVVSNDDNTGGFQMLKEDGGLLNLGFEDNYLRWRRGGGGTFAGWRWDSFENTSLSLTGAGDATFGGDVVAGSTIAEVTAGPANILTTKEWVEANTGGAESDPVFTASPAGGITAGDITNWNTAIQPVDLATVATTGTYGDLINLPTLGTASASAATDFATAAQGTLASTSIQPSDNVSVLTNDAGYLTATTGFSGSFATATETITVVDGLITAVTPL